MNPLSPQERAHVSDPDPANGAPAAPAHSFVEPRADRVTPEGAAAFVEPAPDPLSLFAVDANELIGRMHAGEGGDLNDLVQRTLHDRRAA